MTKYTPPANDDPAAFGTEDDFDSLTDAEIEARIEAGRKALGRELRLSILRLHARALSRPPAPAAGKPGRSRH